MQNVLDSFTQFGPVHAAVLLAILAGTVAAVKHRRRLATDAARLGFDRVLALTALTLTLISHVSDLLPSRFDLYMSLPIHICDVVGIVGPLAILTGRRVFRAMLYYWGLGLSTQAIITPELQYGLASFTFWVFWLPHAMIVVLAVYDLAALRYRPAWGDYFLAIITLSLYMSIVLPLDLWLNVNYGFVGDNRPGQPSVIDFLGPWPLRLYKLAVGALLFLAAMTLPWIIARRQAERRAARVAPQTPPIGPPELSSRQA